jgi:hypothetical protein
MKARTLLIVSAFFLTAFLLGLLSYYLYLLYAPDISNEEELESSLFTQQEELVPPRPPSAMDSHLNVLMNSVIEENLDNCKPEYRDEDRLIFSESVSEAFDRLKGYANVVDEQGLLLKEDFITTTVTINGDFCAFLLFEELDGARYLVFEKPDGSFETISLAD